MTSRRTNSRLLYHHACLCLGPRIARPSWVLIQLPPAMNPFLSAPYLLEQQARRFVLLERRDGRGPKMKPLDEVAIDEFLSFDHVKRYNEVRALEEEQEKFSGGRWPARSLARPLARAFSPVPGHAHALCAASVTRAAGALTLQRHCACTDSPWCDMASSASSTARAPCFHLPSGNSRRASAGFSVTAKRASGWAPRGACGGATLAPL